VVEGAAPRADPSFGGNWIGLSASGRPLPSLRDTFPRDQEVAGEGRRLPASAAAFLCAIRHKL